MYKWMCWEQRSQGLLSILRLRSYRGKTAGRLPDRIQQSKRKRNGSIEIINIYYFLLLTVAITSGCIKNNNDRFFVPCFQNILRDLYVPLIIVVIHFHDGEGLF